MLALETSERIASIATFDGDEYLGGHHLPADQRTAQSLTPAMQAVVTEIGWKLAEIDRVAVAAGPGSFTGLRIGVTAAKTLAYVADAELLGVNTLEAVANQVFQQSPELTAPVWGVIDAQRNEVFAAKFLPTAAGAMCETIVPTKTLPAEQWIDQLQAGDLVAGPALTKFAELIPQEVAIAPQDFWRPTATGVGQLALRQFAAGRRDDPFQLVPNYFRLSAAEEKRLTTENKS